MKTLLDTCVWGGVKQALSNAGHDVVWVGDWQHDPGDDEILDIAYKEKRILITLDKDFGELAIVYDRPHCGIVRLVNLSTIQQARISLMLLDQYGDELEQEAIITAYENRIRIRLRDDGN